MRRSFLIICFSLATSLALAHPLHLSVTNITYENGKLRILMKTFPDDWEVAYFHYHSRVIELQEETFTEIPWFGSYLKERFRIDVEDGGTGLDISVGKISVEEESMSLEMECRVPANPNSLYIYNALLTDIYPDQTNLVIFGFRNRETGIKFDVTKLDAEVILEGLDEENE